MKEERGEVRKMIQERGRWGSSVYISDSNTLVFIRSLTPA